MIQQNLLRCEAKQQWFRRSDKLCSEKKLEQVSVVDGLVRYRDSSGWSGISAPLLADARQAIGHEIAAAVKGLAAIDKLSLCERSFFLLSCCSAAN